MTLIKEPFRENRNVLQFSGYASLCSGNFMNSLLSLEEGLKEEQIDTVYLFEKYMAGREWANELITRKKDIFF